MLHQVIGSNLTTGITGAWTDKYIFPGGTLPSLAPISQVVENQLIIEDIHRFEPYYDKTLMVWHDSFVRKYSEIRDRYNKRFYRMWRYYLLSYAGAFRVRHPQLWKIVLRNIHVSPAYASVR